MGYKPKQYGGTPYLLTCCSSSASRGTYVAGTGLDWGHVIGWQLAAVGLKVLVLPRRARLKSSTVACVVAPIRIENISEQSGHDVVRARANKAPALPDLNHSKQQEAEREVALNCGKISPTLAQNRPHPNSHLLTVAFVAAHNLFDSVLASYARCTLLINQPP